MITALPELAWAAGLAVKPATRADDAFDMMAAASGGQVRPGALRRRVATELENLSQDAAAEHVLARRWPGDAVVQDQILHAAAVVAGPFTVLNPWADRQQGYQVRYGPLGAVREGPDWRPLVLAPFGLWATATQQPGAEPEPAPAAADDELADLPRSAEELLQQRAEKLLTRFEGLLAETRGHLAGQEDGAHWAFVDGLATMFADAGLSGLSQQVNDLLDIYATVLDQFAGSVAPRQPGQSAPAGNQAEEPDPPAVVGEPGPDTALIPDDDGRRKKA